MAIRVQELDYWNKLGRTELNASDKPDTVSDSRQQPDDRRSEGRQPDILPASTGARGGARGREEPARSSNPTPTDSSKATPRADSRGEVKESSRANPQADGRSNNSGREDSRGRDEGRGSRDDASRGSVRDDARNALGVPRGHHDDSRGMLPRADSGRGNANDNDGSRGNPQDDGRAAHKVGVASLLH